MMNMFRIYGGNVMYFQNDKDDVTHWLETTPKDNIIIPRVYCYIQSIYILRGNYFKLKE